MSKNYTFPVQRAGCAPERLTRRADFHQLSFFMVFQETLITSYFCQPRPAKKSSEYLRIVPGTFPAQLFSMIFQMDFSWFSVGFQFDFCWISVGFRFQLVFSLIPVEFHLFSFSVGIRFQLLFNRMI